MARPTISLQAAIGPGSIITNPFIIGTSLIGGTDVIVGREIYGQGGWQEIGDRCYSLSLRRGRQRRLETYKAGTITADLDNADGALDPAWTTGPYTDGAGTSRVKAMAGVQVVATYLGNSYPLAFGYADSWTPTLQYPEGGRVALQATDAFKIFANINPVPVTPVGAGDTTGARIGRILDVANWSATLRDLDTGQATHQATDLSGPTLTQLQVTADSERGDFYMGPDGKVVERQRLYRYTSPASTTPQWFVGDSATAPLQPSAFQPSNDDDVLYNDVNVSRVGGTTVSRSDPTLATYPYLRKSYNRSDLTLADDGQVASYADEVYRTSNVRGPAVRSLLFEPDAYDDLWTFVLGCKFGDRVRITSITHPATGAIFTGDYFIEGIDHDVPVLGPGGWQTRIWLADASKYPTNPFIIGSSLIGGTDVIV